MKSRQYQIVTLVAAALLAPAISMANTEWHQENSDRGFSYHPEHAQRTLGRAQVQSDARSAEPGRIIREGAPLDTFPAATSTRTREQVRSEQLSLSADEKQRLQQLTRGN
ncbi:hypothetical protein [Azohydromonas caseinilytica]|uniref:DUF4148 domain-containing protein n=1 Tax=Azohydromonas caseinilytica TaxID=2728836 RepID=A0A848FCP0_9BURK|nr:hypothetical protein [Azohydromonas caseinilytica]NML17072.1 hypothetical protein [Azohydromonas caseinilytica]